MGISWPSTSVKGGIRASEIAPPPVGNAESSQARLPVSTKPSSSSTTFSNWNVNPLWVAALDNLDAPVSPVADVAASSGREGVASTKGGESQIRRGRLEMEGQLP